MDIIEQSITIIVYCLAVFGIVYIIRKVLEFSIPKLLVLNTKLNKFWQELALPTMPVIIGGLAGLIPQYPYPVQFISTYSHVFFGIFCGLISGLVYRLVKQNFVKKTGGDLSGES